MVEYFKTTFLNIKLQRLCKSHHLQCIKSSKDSEKLEEISVGKGQGRRPCWMPVVFGPSGDTASLIDMILSLTLLTLLNGPRNTSRRTTVGIHNLQCHLQMPTKALSCKKEAICEHGPEAPSCPVGQGSFKMDCFKVRKVFYGQTSQIDILVGNHRRRVLWAKEEGDLPACYQRSVQKPASLMVWGCISAYGMGSLHVLEGTMNE